MIKGLLNAPKQGNERYQEFVEDRLVKGKVNIYQPIKRLMLTTGLKKTKKQPKAVSIPKQDRQASGTLLTKSVNLEVAFQHPLTEIPLSIATPGGELRQAPKHVLRNHIIEEANAISIACPENARWLVDGMAAMRCVKARASYKEWLLAPLKFSTPIHSHPLSVKIINDTYRKDSVKSGTMQKRGDVSARTHIQEYDQKMLQGNAWKNENYGWKKDLKNGILVPIWFTSNFCFHLLASRLVGSKIYNNCTRKSVLVGKRKS